MRSTIHLREAIRLKPDNLEAAHRPWLCARTIRKNRRGDREIPRSNPAQASRRPVALHVGGRLLRAGQRPDQAIAACRDAIRLVPDNADFLLTFGFILEHSGKSDEAIVKYRDAIKLTPGDFTSYTSGLAPCFLHSRKIG